MTKPLYLFVGPSGSGKTTIAELAEDRYDYKSILSYTTRKPRYENEGGHTFISEDEFDALQNIVAYTEYNGFRYCTTEEQLNESDLYVVDIHGVETLLQNYKNTNRLICVLYFDSTVHTRINRMLDRHDSDMAIISRLLQDEEYDWYKKLNQLVWHYSHIENKNVELYKIDANKNRAEVFEQASYYMNQYTED